MFSSKAKNRFNANWQTILLPVFAVLCFSSIANSVKAAETTPIPVPKNIVYAGQVISANVLRDRIVPVSYVNRTNVFTRHSDVVGKVAKTTLVPARPIPTNYVTEPNAIQVNQRALMVFNSGNLSITAEVSPLNSAQAGQQVRARNIQTGVVVYGVAQEDGTILAGSLKR